jgi:ParB-like nuclease domain
LILISTSVLAMPLTRSTNARRKAHDYYCKTRDGCDQEVEAGRSYYRSRHRDNADAADQTTGAKPSSVKVVRVRIVDIAIPEKSRSIRQDTVDALAVSMNQIGLRTPISVRNSKKGIQLVAGRHRLEAAKKLGWKRIDAIVMHDDKLDRRIWHNAENLDRADLTALERAEAVAERAKDVEKGRARCAPRRTSAA